MQTYNGPSEERNRDNENALKQQLELNREQFIDLLLDKLGFEDVLQKDFDAMIEVLKEYEESQYKYLQAYLHEKTMNDHFFNGLYGD